MLTNYEIYERRSDDSLLVRCWPMTKLNEKYAPYDSSYARQTKLENIIPMNKWSLDSKLSRATKPECSEYSSQLSIYHQSIGQSWVCGGE